jgi:hypothetical protein
MTLNERLGELLDSLQIDDPRDKVDLRLYCKWRIQAKCLLINYLGEDHLYTKELVSALSSDPDPSLLGSCILTAKGILEALREDLDSGMIGVKGPCQWNSLLKGLIQNAFWRSSKIAR